MNDLLGVAVTSSPAPLGGLQMMQGRRHRRSYSVVNSLDKLTRKLKNNLMDFDKNVNLRQQSLTKKVGEDDEHHMIISPNQFKQESLMQGRQVKTFIEEKSNEVLIVATEGCYI